MDFTHPRLKRENRTIEYMIELHCRDQHHPPAGGLCAECSELRDYARLRLEHCVFQEKKPTCANCPVHCYKVSMRERVRAMMRYAGPRMMLKRPYLAIAHLMDGWRKAPELPRQKKRESS